MMKTNTIKLFLCTPRARWAELKDLKHDRGAELNKVTEAIEKHNTSLKDVLVSINFSIKNKLSDKKTWRFTRPLQYGLEHSVFCA